MTNTELMQALREAKSRADDAKIAELLSKFKPEDSECYDLAIRAFNISVKNVKENMEVAEWMNENSGMATNFSTITRTALLSNNIKVAKQEDDDDNSNPPSVEFGKI